MSSSMRSARAVLVLVCLGFIACGGGSGGGPTAPTIATPPAPAASTFLLVFGTSAGSYTATLNNQSYSATGGFPITLGPGTYTIKGSFRGQGFTVAFQAYGVAKAGVLSGSARVISGPAQRQVTQCQIMLFNIDTPSVSRDFEVEFRVTSDVGSSCQF